MIKPSILCNKTLLSSLILLCMTPAVFAEELDQEEDVIEVVGSIYKAGSIKLYDTQSTDVIDNKKISEKNDNKVDEALSYTSGVLAGSYGHDGKTNWLKIRGLDASYTIDGMSEITTGYFNNTPETYGLERIEVVKGASSQLYGSSKPGGTVNLITKRPKGRPEGEVSLIAGNHSEKGIRGDYSGVLTDDNSVRYRVIGSYRDEDGQQDYTGLKHYYFAPSLTWDMSDKTSITLLSSFQKDYGIPENGFFPAYGTLISTPYGKIDRDTYFGEPDFDDFNRKTALLGYEIRHEFDNGMVFTQNYKYAHQDLKIAGVYGSYTDNDRTYIRNSYQQDGSNITHTIDNRLSKVFEGDAWQSTVLIGSDYLKTNLSGQDYNNYGDSQIDLIDPEHGQHIVTGNFQPFKLKAYELGFYAQNEFIYDNKLILNQGIRHSRIKNNGYWSGSDFDREYSKNTFNLGAMYIFENDIAPYISYSESFLPVYGYNDSNKTLYRPYEAKQWESGIKYSPYWMDGELTLAYFDIKAQNAFTSNGTGQASQSLETRSKGVELEVKAQVTDNINVDFAYTYTDSKTDQSASVTTRTALIPKHSSSVWVNYAFDSGSLAGLTIGNGIRYVGKTSDEAANPGLDVPAYAIWDAMVKYQFSPSLSLQVNATNLTNKNYVSGCNYWCYYGAERNITGTLTYKW